MLDRPTVDSMIDATKQAFAHHGIPDEIVWDNGPQFSAQKFKQFARQWEFTHTTSSPYYPKSNGLAESMVKSVKRLIKKCNRSKEDIYQGLLILLNAPLSCGQSPSQLLHGKQMTDNLASINYTPSPDSPT